ncbi:hypothetical protein GCM10018952_51090 [Streptosporangium vulgare]
MEPLLILHAVAAVLAPALVRRFGRDAFFALAVPPACGVAYTVRIALDGVPVESHHGWAPALGLGLSFRADAPAVLMMALVTGVGALVVLYCSRYFAATAEGLGRFAGVLVAFAGAMLGLVVADDLLLLYVFWELTTLFSYLLIGHDPASRTGRRAAMQALTVTTLGGLAMLGGMVVLGEAAGTYRISRIVADPPSGGLVPVAVALVLVGALSKSAIFPFSMWLPAAMAAPTPVSAYLHAAAMVKAGVYLLARLGPAFGDLAAWRWTAVPLGLLTMLLGAWRALREYDLKKLLAYGTVSQLGFLTVLFGAATRDTAIAGAGMLLAHALFKASLFLVVGVVDHATGTRDLRELSGLRRSAPWLFATAAGAAASMAGIPPFLGFVGKEAAFESLLTGRPADTVVLAGVVLGSALTAGYSARFLWGAFGSEPGREPVPVRRTGAAMFLPPALLSALGLAAAPLAGRYGEAMEGYTGTFPGPGHGTHLALWSGAPVPLLLSAAALAGGALLFLVREPLVRVGTALHVVDSGRVYWALVRGLGRFSLQLTGVVQRGSLPDYLMIAFVSLAGVAAFSLLYGPSPGLRPDVVLWERVEQPVIGVLLMATAAVALRVRSHIVLVLVAGLTGYGTALLFLVHGSPDLALTQFLVETLSLVVFVLVLRRLPLGPREDRPRVPFGARLVLGVVSGAVAAGAGGARDERAAGDAGRHDDGPGREGVGSHQRRQRDPGRHQGLGHHGGDLRARRPHPRHDRPDLPAQPVVRAAGPAGQERRRLPDVLARGHPAPRAAGGHLRARGPAHLPHGDGGLGLPAVHRARRGGRGVRRGHGRRSRAGHALSRRRPVRAGRRRAGHRRGADRPGAPAVRGHRVLGAAGRFRAAGHARRRPARPARRRPAPVDRAAVRRRGLRHGDRHGAGRPARPGRRAGPADRRGGGPVTAPLLPLLVAGTLVATGVTLLLERSLVRLLAGVILLGNGVNLLILTASGPPGRPPILGTAAPERMADPLPQAMVLTAIVITLGVTAFLLAMVHRSWQLTGADEVQDDTEDRWVRLRARRGELGQDVLERREAYQRLVREQRAELARLREARHERERREAAELEQRILDVNIDLGRWLQEHKDEGLSAEQLAERFAEARRAEEVSKEKRRERVREMRAEFARREREQVAREREIRRRLHARRRDALRQMRAAIRADRVRQARAQDDTDLEGED